MPPHGTPPQRAPHSTRLVGDGAWGAGAEGSPNFANLFGGLWCGEVRDAGHIQPASPNQPHPSKQLFTQPIPVCVVPLALFLMISH